MNPLIDIDSSVVEIGGDLTGTVRYNPDPDDADRVRGLVLELQWRTADHGDDDEGREITVRLEAESDGSIAAAWRLPIPATAPVSFNGRLVRIEWVLTARLDVKRRPDPDWTTGILVVPQGGASVYRDAHPLPRR